MFRIRVAIYFSLALFLDFSLVLAAELPRVELDTSMGVIELELYEDKAPKTVKNFLKYIETEFYNGLIFHRVVEDWVIQAGAFDKELIEYETYGPIRNEAANGLKNLRGTIAMARHDDPHSADSQFFINLKNNASLDHRARTLTDYGYCVFGHVVKGMDVVSAIGSVETHEIDGMEDVPIEAITIRQARIIEQ